MLIGGIEVGRYAKITRYALARAFDLNEGLISVTRQVEKIIKNNGTLSATLALTKEEAEKNYNETRLEPVGPLRVIFQGSWTRIAQLLQRRDLIWLAVQSTTRLLL